MSLTVASEAPATTAAKMKALGLLAKQLEKEKKEPVLLRMGDRVGAPVPHRETGLASLDHVALGIGGIPDARIIEIFGPESAGKTTTLLQIIAAAQARGETAAIVDAEHALDVNWAAKLGVNVNDLFICQPDTAEEALQVMHDLVYSQAADIVALDSVAALAPKAELEGEVGDAHVGLVPRLMAQTLRKITGGMNKTANRPNVIMLNQIREKIGVLYGNPETQPGGRALKFYASVRMDVRRREWIKKGETVIGSQIKIKIIKNKVAPPFKECFQNLYFGNEGNAPGFDKTGSWLDLAFDRGVVGKKDGTTFFFNHMNNKGTMVADKVGIGEQASKDAIRENAELLAAVQAEVKRVINTPVTA
jgi:recombination protein RecA